ncbi:MAG TPA: hypothetical protein VFB67_01505, partial [Candidatus Polarisedimenticolaceae bacterium]|nr:hypothetical protein [Candidatus Polarisedimenticolaceae bacterium]
ASSGVIEHRQAGSELIVDVDPPIDGERTLTFAIAGQPRPKTETEISAQRAILAPSSSWYPTLPGTWAASAVTIRVPAGWGAAASGTPTARTAAGVFRFTNDKPVRTIAVAAAPGLKSADGTLAAVPFRMAAVASAVPVKSFTPRLTPAMAWLSGALAPYAFEGFQLVTLPGYTGRVSASGIAIVGGPLQLATDADGADLLAGQWFGEALPGDGAWIEAFAAWEACVFARDRGLPIPREIARLRGAYFQLLSGDVALSKAQATAPEEVIRGKGSAAPDMVRLVAGDRAMFDAIRELFAAPAGAPLTLRDLRAVLERHAQRPLERAFTEWFERPGAPEIAAELRSFPASSGGFRADIRLTQKRGIYALPVDLIIHGAGESHRETVELDDETTSVFYVVPFEPTRIEIDPLNRLFRWK